MLKKNIFLRTMYDFANSLVMIIFLFSFSQRVVLDNQLSELWWNITLPIASLVFILLAPYAGKYIDHGGSKIQGLRLWTTVSLSLFACCGLLANLSPQAVYLTIILYALAMWAYLLCFVYYTPMLYDLTTKDNFWQISWRGQGVNSFGQIIGLLISIPIIQWSLPWLGTWRVATFLPATMLFLVFALPMLLRYDQPDKKHTAYDEVSGLWIWQLMRQLLGSKILWMFLLGYFFYSDALLTFSSNFPLYLEKVHSIDDTRKSLLTACILLCASIGAFFSGTFADKRWLARSLQFLLVAWCIILPVFMFIKWFVMLAVMSCIAGFFYGPVRSISRALFTKILPKHLSGTGFTYFTMCERFSTFVWPLIWWGVISSMEWSTTWYMYALFAMSLLVAIGAWLHFASSKLHLPS